MTDSDLLGLIRGAIDVAAETQSQLQALTSAVISLRLICEDIVKRVGALEQSREAPRQTAQPSPGPGSDPCSAATQRRKVWEMDPIHW